MSELVSFDDMSLSHPGRPRYGGCHVSREVKERCCHE